MKNGIRQGRLPMNIQFFAEAAAGGSTGQETTSQTQNSQASGQQSQTTGQQPAQIDYAKIQQMLDGTLAAKEDTALKAYFKQQGLSQQEAEQAMADFKRQKAANQPNVAALQGQVAQSQTALQEERIRSAAILAAVGLGIDAKTVPYVLKLADLSQAVGQDGKISDEALKNALNKVLEDVPALKPQASGSTGFIQVGASSGSGGGQGATEEQLDKIFGVKKG